MIFNISEEISNSNAPEPQFPPHKVLIFSTLCMCLVGIPGTVITICYHGKYIKNGNGATASLLAALATYDMLSLLTTFLQMLFVFFMVLNDPMNGIYLISCHYYVTNYLTRFPKYCSNFLLMIIAIERLYSVVKPHEVKKVFTKKVGVICIATVTLIIPLSLLPRAFEYTCVPFIDKKNQAKPYTIVYSEIGKNRSNFVWVYIITGLFFYLLPLLGIIISNTVLIAFLLKRVYSKTSVLPITMNQKREMKVTKLVLIVTFIFVIFVSPLGIFSPLVGISSTFRPESVYREVLPIAMFLETINYSANTVIYYAGSTRFRAFAKRFICKVICKSSQVAPSSSD